MIDLRIYRAAFVPALVVLVVLMFSVEPLPGPLGSPRAGLADEFDGRRAATTAREIAELAPDRRPGSSGDGEAADLVAEHFEQLGIGRVSEQEYDGELDGDDVVLRNVVLTLPGESPKTIVVLAARDSARGAGAASTASATGALVELAGDFAGTRHTKTLVFVSTDGGSDGASGAREFIETLPDTEAVEAVVVLSQPGAAEPRKPHVIAWSAGPQSSSIQLVQSADAAVESEIDESPGVEGFFGNLFRLALPSGLGEQAVVIEEGIPAVALAGAGERVLDPEDDEVDSLSVETLSAFGRAAAALVVSLDQATGPLAESPGEYLTFAGNVIPGWSLSLLALALLLPALLTAGDGLARASRAGEPIGLSFLWVASRALPFLAVLILAYVLAVPGIAPHPEFPFDPGRFDFGLRAAGVLIALLIAFALSAAALRPLAVPRRPTRAALAPAIGVVAGLAVLAVWLFNPYLALLLIPLAHVWLIATGPQPMPLPGSIPACLLALLPIAVGVGYVVDRLDLGLGFAWPLLLTVTGGHVPLLLALLGCLLGGALLGLLALSRGPGGRDDANYPPPDRGRFR